ncbi:sodium/proline symporter [Candidatus Bandiella euplotis]|uniref:sodium/proline symporter n=1 Tax=Candidatus Bandiella euplotis TaxID=1664265 RepID=UPI002B2612A0|nr:sodium/proline symporter [Candidatus Bandiella woodruffii]
MKNTKDFVLGGRKFNAVTTALGAGAADMSAWLMMGLPGAVYLYGASEMWLPIGLSVGAYLNWQFVARRLRVYTQKYGNSLTIPSYLANRFSDASGAIKVTAVVTMFMFFMLYIASALIALAVLINTFTNFEYTYCLWFGAAFIFVYTSIGGFVAVTWSDVMQGSLMLFALIVVPIAIVTSQGSISTAYNNFQALDINTSNPFLNMSVIGIISLLSWGIGYFGQPHILVRFMAIKQSRVMNVSQKICMGWMILSLIGAFCVGLFGKVLFNADEGINPESIFLLAADRLFPEWLAGVVLAAVLSAIMSTISSQLHAISCSLAELDFKYKASHKIWHTRSFMFLVVTISTLFAHKPNNTILGLVSVAWAGLGSAFGPVILLSLYFNKVTKQGAMYGMITGGVTVIIWHSLKEFGGIFELYEIIPGFILSSIVIFIQCSIFSKTSVSRKTNENVK